LRQVYWDQRCWMKNTRDKVLWYHPFKPHVAFFLLSNIFWVPELGIWPAYEMYLCINEHVSLRRGLSCRGRRLVSYFGISEDVSSWRRIMPSLT
jgi:hypothetical protein